MRLLERDAHLDGLRAALERARRGRGSIVLVSGEAGIGKSSLLAEFADRSARHARLFRGSCEDLVTARTLGPFRDMTRQLPGVPLGVGPGERDALLDALLAEMSFTQRPAVVMVEDAHWADQASLDVLRALARRVPELPALLVISYREEELGADHPLWRVVGGLAGSAVVRLELPALSDAAVAMLAAEAGVDPAPVAAAAAGNPFLVTEVLATPGGPGGEVPTSVRHAVLARVSTLPPACRDAVARLAVVPTEVPASLLSELVPDPAALEPAERRGILRSSYGAVRFRHELARRAVEEALPGTRRAALHRRVFDALAAAGAEPSRLVHHAVAVGDASAVARYGTAAAREAAAANGHREAVAYAELAIDSGRLAVPAAAELHGLAARAAYALNRFRDAARHADRAVELWDAAGTTPLGLGEALLISARMSTLLADPAAAREKAVRALAVLEPFGPTRQLALAHSTLGSQDALQARFDEAMARLDTALELARRTGAEDVAAHALNYRGVSLATLGDEAGLADLRESVARARALGHADYATVAAHNLAVMLLRSARIAEAEPYLELGAAVAGEHRLEIAAYRIEAQRCYVLILRGQWDEAERRLRALLDAGDEPGADAVNPLAFLGRLLARRGDPAGAGFVERAWALASATGEEQKGSVAAGARIEWLWLAGDTARIRAEGGRLLEFAVRAQHPYLRAEMLRYRRRAGERVEPFAGCPAPFAAGIEGDWATAAALWERAGNPYEQALELAEAPDPEPARAGLAMLDQLGAAAAANVCRRRLRRAGVAVPRGPRAATRSNPGRLTDRQLEVLALLAEGRTNAEIAARLVVSPRTVDNHVAALLRRLGVRSRREVAAAAAELGLPVGLVET
jgi:DNA-binding CsgD family transcriptional regulator/tetratricopeptide (TPR) repeat protein